MKSLIRILFVAMLVSSSASLWAGDPDRWETLQAINMIENPTNSPRPGRHGELGPYQFRRTTWRMHTKRSFQLAIQREHADEIAIAHYQWIKERLENNGLPTSTYNIAMAWNAGVDAVISGRVPRVSRGYAQRVTNIVGDLKRRDTPSIAAVDVPVTSYSAPMVYMAPFIQLQ